MSAELRAAPITKGVKLKYNGTFLGLIVEKLDQATIDKNAWEGFVNKRDNEAFKVELLMALSDPKQTLQAYVLLNRLYPKQALQITARSFPLNYDDLKKSRVPIKVMNGKQTLLLSVSMDEFGKMVQSHWSYKFGLIAQLFREQRRRGLIPNEKKNPQAKLDGKAFLEILEGKREIPR